MTTVSLATATPGGGFPVYGQAVAEALRRRLARRIDRDTLTPVRRGAYRGRVGLFHVRASLTGPGGRTEDVDLLVDTGATLLVVPRSLSERLGLEPRRSQPVLIAGGQRTTWPVAEVRVALEGRDVATPCFIAPDGPALLGAVALESLFFGVDPVAKRLVPVEGFVG